VAVFSYADSGFFSPDVQQQVVTGVVQIWVLVTAAALMVVDRRASGTPRSAPAS
jgi:hypothetical protein